MLLTPAQARAMNRQNNLNMQMARLPISIRGSNNIVRNPANAQRNIRRKINRLIKRENIVRPLTILPTNNFNSNRNIRRNVRMMGNQLGIRRPIRANRVRYSTVGGANSGEIISNNTETIGQCQAGMNYFKFQPGNSNALVLDKLASLYDLYNVSNVRFLIKSGTSTFTNGQYRAAIDYNGTLPKGPNQIEAMTNSKIDNVYKNTVLVAKRDTLNKVLKYSTYDPENPERSQFQTTACTLCLYLDPSVTNTNALTVQVTYTVHFYTIKAILATEEPTSTAISQIIEVNGSPQLTPSILIEQPDSLAIEYASAQSLSENSTVDSFILDDTSPGTNYSFATTVGNKTPFIRLRDQQGNIIPPSSYKILSENPSFKKVNKDSFEVYNYSEKNLVQNLKAGPITILAGILEIINLVSIVGPVFLDIVRPWFNSEENSVFDEQDLLFDAVSALSPGNSLELILPDSPVQEVFDNFNNFESVFYSHSSTDPSEASGVSLNSDFSNSNLSADKIQMTISDPLHDPISKTFDLTTTIVYDTIYPRGDSGSGVNSSLQVHLFFTDSNSLFKIGQNYAVSTSIAPGRGSSSAKPFGRLLSSTETNSKTANVVPYNNSSYSQYVQNFTVTKESTEQDFYVFTFDLSKEVISDWGLGIEGKNPDLLVLFNYNISDLAAVNRSSVTITPTVNEVKKIRTRN